MAILYPDEIFYTYLKGLYTPYRNSLGDPTVLPAEDAMMWNNFIGGVWETAFIVAEDYQQPSMFVLGGGNRQWDTAFTVYVMTLWPNEGKPPYLKEFAKFLERYLIVTPIPNYIRTAGIEQFHPTQFQLTQGLTSFRGFGTLSNIQSPEMDYWVLAVNVRVKYFQHANVAP